MFAIIPFPAGAHDPFLYYEFWWQEGVPNTPNVGIFFADHDFDNGGVAGAKARDSVSRGHGAWNAASSRMKYFAGGFNYGINYAACNSYKQNGIFWLPIPGSDAAADTKACVWSDNVDRYWSFNIRFNQNLNWNKDAEKAPTLLQLDLLSFAAHEAGHGVGHWLHWDDLGAVNICNNPNTAQTMCRATAPGITNWRSLGTHDKHTFKLTYP